MAGSAPTLFVFLFPGTLSVGAFPYRTPVPFNYQVIGATVSCAVPPVGANVIVDILRYPNNSTSGISFWAINNGTNGKPDYRPKVVAGAYDQAEVTASPSPGETNPWPWVAQPDVNAEPSQLFVGDQPANDAVVTPVVVNSVEAGSANWPSYQAPEILGYYGNAGDILVPSIVQVGSTSPGSDAQLVLWVTIS